MSLLTDHDYLLHSLRLSYLRLIVPAHAPTSTLPGTGPFNLLAFNPTDPTLANPYVQADGLVDEQDWPELAAGRNSPPLGTGFRHEPRERSQRGLRNGVRNGRVGAAGAEEAEAESKEGGAGGREGGGGGGGGLSYSQTIGGKVGGAGMRVSGRSAREGAASFRSRKMAERDQTERDKADPIRSGQAPDSFRHRRPLEPHPISGPPFYHNQTDGSSKHAIPPSLVIHSPVRSPAGSVYPTRANSLFDLASAITTANPTPGFTPDGSPQIAPTTLTRDANLSHPDAAHAFGGPKPGPGEDSDGQFAGGLGPLALAHVNPSGPALLEGLETNVDASVPLVFSPVAMSLAPESPMVGPSAAAATVSPSIPAGFAPGSVASSGVSLFGASLPQTLPEVAKGGGLNRDRSESETSGALAGPSLDEDAILEPGPEAADPVAPLPARPVGRERRRVNISGRMLASIAEPAQPPSSGSNSDEDGGPPAAQLGHRRRSTEPAVAFQVVSGKKLVREADGTSRLEEGARTRKVSAPGALPPPAGGALAGLAPSMSRAASANSAASLAPPPSSNGRKQARPPPSPVLSFPSRASMAALPVAPLRKSALTAMLSASAEDAGPVNPFARLYGALSTKGNDGLGLSVYFPHSKEPRKAIKVKVKRDLTCEEVIGVGLFAYFEEGREPSLELGEDEEGETVKWNLRIVEDDGEVDEDFPALDRTRAVAKFGFNEFAVVKANALQMKDNATKQATVVRRPSRTLAPSKRPTPLPPPPTLVPPVSPTAAEPHAQTELQGQPSLLPTAGGGGNAGLLAPAGTSFAPTTMGVTSGIAVPVLLRVRLPAPAGAELDSVQTTLEVPSDMYLGDVLDLLCRKQDWDNPREWALMVHYGGEEIVVPLDRTVDSLGERHELYLVRRSQVAALGGKQLPPSSTGYTNPSANIFQPQRPSVELREQGRAEPVLAGYETYHVQRKLPVPMGRHPRLIAIDGDYLHFLPSDQPGRGTSGRTSSYHISQVVQCGVSRRGGGNAFKVVVRRERGEKRYDFEAEDRRVCEELVGKVRALMASWAEEEGRR